jgi:hypothetical protein
MIITSLPMMVFGEPATTQPIQHRTVVTQHPQRPADHIVEIEFDIRQLRNAGTTDAAIELILSRTNLAQASFGHELIDGFSGFNIFPGDTANTVLQGFVPSIGLTVESGGVIPMWTTGTPARPVGLPTGASGNATNASNLPAWWDWPTSNPGTGTTNFFASGAARDAARDAWILWGDAGVQPANWNTMSFEDQVAWKSANTNHLVGSRHILGRFNFPTIPRDAEGTIVVQIPIRVNYTTVTLDANLMFNTMPNAPHPFARTILATAAQLVSVTATTGLTITSGDYRRFTDVLSLPPITINEGQNGNFRTMASGVEVTANPVNYNLNQVLVRLEAPVGYEWRTAPIAGIATTPYIAIVGSPLTWGRTGAAGMPNARGAGATPNANWYRLIQGNTVNHVNREERVNFQRLNVMYITVNTSENNTFNAPRSFEIRNLHLVPEHDNNSMGPVDVRVSTVPRQMLLDGDGNVWREPAPNYNLFLTNRTGNHRFWHTSTERVGYRVPDGLVIEVLGDVPTVRTGYLGSDLTRIDRTQGNKRAFVGNAGQGTRAAGVPANLREEQGVRTATIEIRETVPGAWGQRLGERLEFTFPHEGVRIMGAVARAGSEVGDHTNRHNVFPNTNPGSVGYANVWEGGWLVPGANTTPWNRVQTDNIIVTENMVTVIVPPLGATQLLNRTRAVQVTFWLSVEAGFEAKFPGDTLDVVVGGASVGLLSENSRTQTVAIPADPFIIAADLTEIRTDILSTISQEPISDIVITVEEPHLLREGAFIDVLIAGAGANMAIGLHIYADRTVTVDGNGLIIGTGSVILPSEGGAGVTGGTMLRFPVSRVPNARDNDGPVTITISNVHVSGTVVPHIEYQAVVRGTAIAENHVTLSATRTAGVGEFTSHPYFTPAVVFAGGILEEMPELPGGGLPGGNITLPQLRERHFWVGMPSFVVNEVVLEPFLLQPTVAGGVDVSLIALREFGHFIGDHDPVWSDNGVLRAQITGQHRNGSTVTVAVENGRTDAIIYVDGVQTIVDIAQFTQYASGPYGTVRPLLHQGRFYLPLRFFAEAFGYTVTFDTTTRVATVRG